MEPARRAALGKFSSRVIKTGSTQANGPDGAVKQPVDRRGDGIDRRHPIDRFQDRLFRIKVSNLRRLGVIGVEPGFERLRGVVGAHRSAARLR